MKTLLLVDIQNDFCSNGNLAVKNGEMVVSVANLAIEHFELVVASQDWHPSDHLSFASQHTSKTVGEMIDLADLNQNPNRFLAKIILVFRIICFW